jgi:hypothetical protein
MVGSGDPPPDNSWQTRELRAGGDMLGTEGAHHLPHQGELSATG